MNINVKLILIYILFENLNSNKKSKIIRFNLRYNMVELIKCIK